jgi:ABC-2 type transport system ATP-binding protein
LRFPVLKANTATGASLPKGVWRAGAAIVEVSHLHRRYGATVAVEDVSFSVAEGEIFGLLGPNGAGKTTTVESIVGLRVPDAGTIRVLGLDPLADHAALRERVGVQLQESAQPPKLRAGEALLLYASFYRHPDDPEHLMETLGLSDKRETFFRDLSGGQKQRLSIALALIGRPTIAVLDELTTRPDPQARRDTWDLVKAVRDRGVTTVLVTHDMQEAQHLCDQVATTRGASSPPTRLRAWPNRPQEARSCACGPRPPSTSRC